MSIKVKKPEVKMNLYETDKDVLKSFITNEKIDGVFTEKYLILQNFADDCRFSSDIQPELMEYLLPFYLRIIEEAIMHQNKMAEDIYSQFNSMIFFNQQNFKNSVGEKYPYVMEYYVEQTVKRMEMGNKTILGEYSGSTIGTVLKRKILPLCRTFHRKQHRFFYSDLFCKSLINKILQRSWMFPILQRY